MDSSFVPAPAELVYSTTDTNWTDPSCDGWNVYYKITAALNCRADSPILPMREWDGVLRFDPGKAF